MLNVFQKKTVSKATKKIRKKLSENFQRHAEVKENDFIYSGKCRLRVKAFICTTNGYHEKDWKLMKN